MGARRLIPDFRERVWGSTRLEPWYPNPDKKIGEVWFEDQPPLPLLVKFIFTTEKLSVQVHPGDEYARKHHGSRGKTEMWHILAAEPGARIAAGFTQSLTESELREASQSGEIETLLNWIDARPGDTFFIPAGTVHAIGAGLALCEIQQNSDVTYRLYDYGRPRELHLDHGVTVSRRDPCDARRGAEVSCEYFQTRMIGSGRRAVESDSELWIAIRGSGTIGDQSIRAGEVFLATGKNEIRGAVTIFAASPG
jgi:mannose-6-phosphate isomerase